MERGDTRFGRIVGLGFFALAAGVIIEAADLDNRPYRHQVGFVAVVGIVFVVALAAWGLALHRLVRRRTAALEQSDARLRHLNRTLRLVTECNQVLARATQETELLGALCRLLVEHGGYPVAWVGLAEQEGAKSVRLTAHAGVPADPGESADFAGTTIAGAMVGAAIEARQPVITRDISAVPQADPWHRATAPHGCIASIALPLLREKSVLGVLMVYATESEMLDAAEVGLLTELAEDIAYGLSVLRTRAEHEQAEVALRHSEEQFQLIMGSLADLVTVFDREGRRLYASPSCANILGNPDQLQGTSSFDQIHPEDRDRVRVAFEETVRTGMGHRLEYRMLDRDGRARLLESQGSAIRDAQNQVAQVVVVSRDITERKLAEKRIEASERKYRELVEHANSIILRWSCDGRVTFLNEFGQRFFGYTEEEIRGRHLVGTIVPETESTHRDLAGMIEQIGADPEAFEQNVNENMRRNGERVWISWANRVVPDEQGKVAEILSIGTDITARKRAEETVRELNISLERRVAERTAELAVAKDRAEEADRLKSAFLAIMSHELRTPLNSIIGFTGILLQGLAGPLNAEQHKQLRMVQDSARHLLALINDVLDISKIEAGQIEIRAAPFDLSEAIRKLVPTVVPLAERKGLALTVQVAPGVGVIRSDRRRVEQVLLNLLSNAIKFTDRGAVVLRAELQRAEVTAGAGKVRASAGVVVSVTDTGIGIQPENLSKLFQPFRQIDSGLTRQHEGTGLGLAICRRLVERLGGEIHVESRWGCGSTFTFTLPVDLASKP